MFRTGRSHLLSDNQSMNIGGIGYSTSFHGTPVCEGRTNNLREAQEEALREPPATPPLKWKRIAADRIVAPLLSVPLEPLNILDRKRAYNAAIYYSECFLKGVTPNDADNAAVGVQQMYRKWWVNGTVHDEPLMQAKAVQDDDESRTAMYVPVVSDDSHHEDERCPKRRRLSLRNVINSMNFSRKVDCSANPEISYDRGTCNAELANISSDRGDCFGISSIPNLSLVTWAQIESVRDRVMDDLKENRGNLESATFQSSLEILQSYYLSSHCDVRKPDAPFEIDGTWLTLSKLTFTECKGRSATGDLIYSLGRMSFDMFRPTGIRCSIQGNFNTVHQLHGELPQNIPRSLRKTIHSGLKDGGVKGLRTYNIVVAFTIEPNQTLTGELIDAGSASSEFVLNKPIRGIMTTFGYAVPDPTCPNRLSIWFTGGQLEVNDEHNDMDDWRRIFDHSSAPKRDMKEFARVLAAKVLLGADIPDAMDESGNMKYTLTRPIGGHGSAYCDVIYMDDKLRIMKGHHGAIFVFSKVTAS